VDRLQCPRIGISDQFLSFALGDIPEARSILIIGSNTTEAHPIVALRIKEAVRKRGASLIVADPRGIEIAKWAKIHIRQRPGTDVALLNGLMHVILKESLEDRDFIKKRTEGFFELKEVLEKYTPEKVEEITGVPKDKIIGAARMFAEGESGAIFYAMGITQHIAGTDNVKAVADLALLTGNLGKPGAGVNPLRGQNNVQGACDMGALPNVFPGYQSVEDAEIRKKFEMAWKTTLPPKRGLTVLEMMEGIETGRIKAMVIMGENPLLSDPDIAHVKEALKKLEFLVVQDIFITETGELADVVLPGATFAEKDGTFTNTERRVQRIRKAIEPLGNSRPDWMIIRDIARQMGAPGFDVDGPEQIFDQIRQVVRTIVLHPSFLNTWGDKIKRPFEILASAIRAGDGRFDYAIGDSDTDSLLWRYDQAGQPLFAWRAPNGFPDHKDDWQSATPRVMSWRLMNWLIDVRNDQDVFRLNVLDQTPHDVRTAIEIADFWIDRIFGYEIPALERDEIVDFMAQGHNPNFQLPLDNDEDTQDRLRSMVGLIFMSPSFLWR